MSESPLSLHPRPFGRTGRTDAWWVQPLAVLLGLSAFIAYSTWAAFQGEHYHHGPYLSPFYSPGVGTLVPTLNVVLWGGCTLGCHSLRHLIGGRIGKFRRSRCSIDDGVGRSYSDRCPEDNCRLEGSGA